MIPQLEVLYLKTPLQLRKAKRSFMLLPTQVVLNLPPYPLSKFHNKVLPQVKLKKEKNLGVQVPSAKLASMTIAVQMAELQQSVDKQAVSKSMYNIE